MDFYFLGIKGTIWKFGDLEIWKWRAGEM